MAAAVLVLLPDVDQDPVATRHLHSLPDLFRRDLADARLGVRREIVKRLLQHFGSSDHRPLACRRGKFRLKVNVRSTPWMLLIGTAPNDRLSSDAHQLSPST